MMVLRYALAALLVSAYLPLFVSPGKAQTVSIHGPLATRLVQLYSDYESRLAEAISRRDRAEIDRLVARNFELRSTDNIATPTPRADWIAQLFTEPTAAVSIGEMAVHDYGSIRVVSFLMERKAVDHNLPSVAIIDVWMKSGNAPILQVRYAALQTPSSQLVPGQVREPHINKQY